MKNTLLWLDDSRDPFENNNMWLVFSPIPLDEINEVIWVKSYEEFCKWIIENGLPKAICFDHDLSYAQNRCYLLDEPLPENEKTGYDCAKWLVDYCMNNKKELPKWNIQSANPEGKNNIQSLLNNYLKFTLK